MVSAALAVSVLELELTGVELLTELVIVVFEVDGEACLG